MSEEEIEKLEEIANHNYQVSETVFNWLLEQGLVDEGDIGPDEDTPESAALVFINIYKKLLKD